MEINNLYWPIKWVSKGLQNTAYTVCIDIVYNLYAVVMENSICGGGIHNNNNNNNNNNVIVPIKGPRRGRVTCKTNIDSMYI